MHGPIDDPLNYRTLPNFAAYIDRIGAELLSYRKFIVKEYSGHYYRQLSSIWIEPDGSIDCDTLEHAPTKQEAEAIKAEILSVIDKWPKSIGASNLNKLTGTTGTIF